MTAHVVYLMRDADGEVIYVGRTGNLKDRMRHHARYSPWINDVALIETSHSVDLEDADELEALYAVGLRPKHNVQLVPGRRDERRRAAILAEIEASS